MIKHKDKHWFYTVEPEYKNCSRAELDEYVRGYPRKLEYDGFMGYASWYDFSLAPYWPEAPLMAQYNFEYEESGWRICTNAEDVYNSRIPGHWAVYDHDEWRHTLDGEILEDEKYPNERDCEKEKLNNLVIDEITGWRIIPADDSR